eukprot:622347-Rhodomonas_salina.3
MRREVVPACSSLSEGAFNTRNDFSLAGAVVRGDDDDAVLDVDDDVDDDDDDVDNDDEDEEVDGNDDKEASSAESVSCRTKSSPEESSESKPSNPLWSTMRVYLSASDETAVNTSSCVRIASEHSADENLFAGTRRPFPVLTHPDPDVDGIESTKLLSTILDISNSKCLFCAIRAAVSVFAAEFLVASYTPSIPAIACRARKQIAGFT